MRKLVVMGLAGLIVLVAAGAVFAARGSGDDRPGFASVAPASTPYGEATRQVQEAWAATLRCQYAHGATKRSIGDDSFEVVGLTPAIRASCGEYEAAATKAMATPAYAAERRAASLLMRDVWACVEARGLDVGSDTGADTHGTVAPEVRSTFAACKSSIETSRGLVSPKSLP